MLKFAGDKKVGTSLLHNFEQKLVQNFTPKIPKCIETYHLTYTSVLWCILIILFGFLAKFNMHWLWGVSIIIALQYLTDLFDGAVGRLRNTGLIKWGYYMDHFLDYMFLCSILISYSFVLPDEFDYLLFFILVILGGFLVNSFLSFSVTNKFKITHLKIGPTEIRILFIIINTMIIFFGKTYMAPALPYVLFFSGSALLFVIYRTQDNLWKIDMEEKN